MNQAPIFKTVPAELNFPQYERQILEFWKSERIFERSIEQRGPDAPDFVFYEGPPTANGLPHNGHVLTRVMKDIFPRYRAMRGYRVLRKGGWDTHGLPVEVEVEKELRIHGKAAIEAYGVEAFVRRCIESVFRYTTEWERLTERIGYWVGLKDAYVTYQQQYVESVWWALSELFKKGLLYQGHKVVWWWAQGGTALSAGEVGEGYKTVDDPSVYVLLPLEQWQEAALVVWTTTPWTLPSNCYAAVKGDADYVLVRFDEHAAGAQDGKRPAVPRLACKKLVLAADLREALEAKLCMALEVERQFKGTELVGLRYRPPFDVYSRSRYSLESTLREGGTTATWWRVLAEDFVTLDSGTGIVHIAPAFGEDDHLAHQRQLSRYAQPEDVELLCAIHPDGTFKQEFSAYAGQWVKDADKAIIAELSSRGLVLLSETYRHEYPFCPRSEQDPLIQLARPAWFIKTTSRIQEAMANNEAVNWLPEHIKHGRFGDFLDKNVDWALSRERYWGTPLNVWVCSEHPEHQHAPASVSEILSRNPQAFAHFEAARRADPSLSEHLAVHRPWIDEVTFPCPRCGAPMRRVPEVIDCWFDSGCMPFAQWGFPHAAGSRACFDAAFPADFISEAIDQTRGWFYSLLMISTMLFDGRTQADLGLTRLRPWPHPFRTCIVLGHVCDREGKKESKSRGNYTPPEIILDRVRMEFGVLTSAPGLTAAPGTAYIAREDLEGMDLDEGAKVILYTGESRERELQVTLRSAKKLPRRLLLLADEDARKLGRRTIESGLATRAPEVLQAPKDQRITLEDPNTPAPGADAFRWFFYASSPPWNNTRHSLTNVRTVQKDFLVKLRNVYSFFVIYANIDGYDPANPDHRGAALAERSLLDRWLLSELALTTRAVRDALDAFLVYDAAQSLIDLAESLSNWYVRRSRQRFWGPGLTPDKRNAYATLHEALVTIALLIAPFTPFFAEEMYQNLALQPGALPEFLATNGGTNVGAGQRLARSVHLADYPAPDGAAVDGALSEEMRGVREIVSLGLSVRTANKLKVRQPLARADVVFNDGVLLQRLLPYRGLIQEELNVHDVRFMFPGHEDGAVSFKLRPNFRALGPRLGAKVQAIKQALEAADGTQLFGELTRTGRVEVPVAIGAGQPADLFELEKEEVEVVCQAAPGFAAETGRIGVVVLHTTLTESLIDEGYLREVQSRVQAARKEIQLDFADRIELWVDGSERLLRVTSQGQATLLAECLATKLTLGLKGAPEPRFVHQVGDETLTLALRRA